ncbi:cysteine dioxygenase family protein [Acetobacteraceae bacterium H6797]|nr:cysteine dioxygenase family protein [Acetobacteraceae bacterium H6797]
MQSLKAMLAAIEEAVSAPLGERHHAVADAIAPYVADPSLLDGMDIPVNPERYARYEIHNDPAGRYAVVALVWAPGQMSPIHAHNAWCSLGVHRGVITEMYYTNSDGETVPSATMLRVAGETSCGPADPTLIHRLANLSCSPVISIHCYGVAFERMSTELNKIYTA